jgi:hypothetical protein
MLNVVAEYVGECLAFQLSRQRWAAVLMEGASDLVQAVSTPLSTLARLQHELPMVRSASSFEDERDVADADFIKVEARCLDLFRCLREPLLH